MVRLQCAPECCKNRLCSFKGAQVGGGKGRAQVLATRWGEREGYPCWINTHEGMGPANTDSLTWGVSCFWRMALEGGSLYTGDRSAWPFALGLTSLPPWLDFPRLPLLYWSEGMWASGWLGPWPGGFHCLLGLFSNSIANWNSLIKIKPSSWGFEAQSRSK